ncbi:hydroxyacylglutathione hydrolase [Oxalobacteraceae bacterium GrIS 1.11]
MKLSHNSLTQGAGLPGSECKVARVLRRHGLAFSDIVLIVITHAHVDHAGSAAALRTLSGAPILAHAGDAAHFEHNAPMRFCPTGWFGRLFIKTRLMLEPYARFKPDLLLDDAAPFDLAPYGIAGVVGHTPGHTAGSLAVALDDGTALVGDLIASGILLGGIALTGQPKRPPFEDDPHAVALALRELVEAGMLRYYMGHGGPLPAQAVARHVAALTALPGAQPHRATKRSWRSAQAPSCRC